MTLYSALYADAEMSVIFSDEGEVENMLHVEAELAQAQAALGIIPPEAGRAINRGVTSLQPDMAHLRDGVQQAGFPVIALVQQIREQVGPPSSDYVHYGATTQDIMDTARVLQIRDGLNTLEARLVKVIHALATLADTHRHTIMAGRTHSQQALPIPFGLKAAGWLAPLIRHRERLTQLRQRTLMVQFGGAAGTLAALAGRGVETQTALASRLGLGVPVMPWHTQRDAFAEVANWLSMVTGSLAKMAQDIILLGQSEVAELRESADAERGGSSTMPQKRNPVLSEIVIACGRANASLLSGMHAALIQEHERGTHGWQVEWLSLPRMFTLAGVSLTHALDLSTSLVVSTEQMARSIAASHGLMLAEAAVFALAETMPRTQAKALVREACAIAAERGQHLITVLRDLTSAPLDWSSLKDEANYLGEAATFIDQVLHAAQTMEVPS